MAYTKVKFLGKEYKVSDYLPILVPILQKFDSYQENLIKLLVDQMKSKKYSGGADEDFVFWDKPIRSIAKNVIVMAADNGIYDLTESELVDKNPGYNQLNTVCTNTIKNIAKSYADSIQTLLDESERAFNDAASNITGSGVSVWTNSLANAMWYNFLEGRVLMKQAKEADKQYNAEIRKISNKSTQNQRATEYRIINEYYYPGCNKSINQIIATMLYAYLAALDRNGIINCEEISEYNLDDSDEIMKNLEIISQKIGVLGKAFEKCPYNAAIYEQALKLKLLDDESIQTVKYLRLEEGFTALLDDYISDQSENIDVATIRSRQYYVHLQALFHGLSDVEYRNKITRRLCNTIESKYDSLYKIITDESLCTQYAEKNKDTKNLDKLLENEVRGIISKQEIDYLTDDCAHNSILDNITPSEIKGERDKDTIDEYYIKSLKAIVIPKVSEILESDEQERIQNEIRKEKEIKRQSEIRKQKEKKKFIIVSIISSIVLCLIVIAVVIFYVVPAQKKQDKIHKAEELKHNLQYDEAIELYSELGDEYTDDIKSCKYEKAESLLTDKKYAEAAELYKSISDYNDSSDKMKECEYLHAIEMDKNGDVKNAAKLFLALKDYKDSRDRYIELIINAGYVSFRQKETYNRKNEEATQYSTAERAYRFISSDDASNEKIGVYVICIEEGRERTFGYIDLSKEKYQTIGPAITDTDSEMYVFSEKKAYEDKDYEKSIIHKSIVCVESDGSEITKLREGINVTAGFCTYDSNEDNIIIKESSKTEFIGSYGYKVHGKPFIHVDGLNENESITLYTIIALETDGCYIYLEEGKSEYSPSNNCIINDMAPDWKKYVVDNPFGGDAEIYVFADYNSYMDHDFENAIASGKIGRK